MYPRLKRSLLHHLNSRMKKQRYLHVKWEVVRIFASCHKVIHNHCLCFNVIWCSVRCTRIPDNHTAPSAWMVHVSDRTTVIQPSWASESFSKYHSHVLWRICKRVCVYAPRRVQSRMIPTRSKNIWSNQVISYLPVRNSGGILGPTPEEAFPCGFIVSRLASASRCRNDQRRLNLAEC